MSVLYLEQEKQVYWPAPTLEEALLEWAGPPLQKQDNRPSVVVAVDFLVIIGVISTSSTQRVHKECSKMLLRSVPAALLSAACSSNSSSGPSSRPVYLPSLSRFSLQWVCRLCFILLF
ncbi:hypothetical protein EYF80_011418 [Liparis tanakae]|uniref:Uncharacterized protein n=1 Tax=Liparis tanakae TaxID=230148 RepID=A0A4Z2ILU6_9TELE|nr:hypothetical protein EYF80_011418 [Liparis tanakae]